MNNSEGPQTDEPRTSPHSSAPQLIWSASSYDLGDVLTGSDSATLMISLTNQGNAVAAACAAPVLSNSADFKISSDNCGTSDHLAGAACTITIQATPSAAGTRSTIVSRRCGTSGDLDSPAFSVRGTAPSLFWSLLSHEFGQVSVGESSGSRIFTLTNSGTADASGCSRAVISNVTDFTVVNDTCGTDGMSANGGSCTIIIRANPISRGSKSTTLSRTCTVGGSPSTTENQITATGVAPVLEWSSSSYIFGNLVVGTSSSSRFFTLTNSGDGPATGCSDPTISNSTDFSLSNDTCGSSSIAAGSSCSVSIRANPASTGIKSATLSRFCFSGGSVATLENQITVTSVDPPILSWSPAERAFGNVTVGVLSESHTIALANTGTGAATGCSAPAISNSTDFRISQDDCGTSDLSSGSSCFVTVQARPQSSGTKSATLSRTCSIGGTLSSTADGFTVTGLAPIPQLSWNESSKAFGEVRVGRTSSEWISLLRNTGTSEATDCGPPILSNTTDFSIVSHTCLSTAMAAHTSCRVTVRATPGSGGSKSGTLSRSCSAGITASVSLTASGHALFPTQIAKGHATNHTCILMSDGSVRCWGFGTNGQLGRGDWSNGPTPAAVSGISTATTVVAGMNHYCALLTDRTIRCWGNNSFGQLGDGTTTSRASPVQVSGVNTAIALSAGLSHTCALLSTGRVMCWGLNTSGRLGDGTTTNRSTPVEVLNLSDASAVAAGGAHTCALISTSGVKCWGANSYGAVGDGTTSTRLTSVDVSDLSTVTALAAGSNHSCALLADGSARCWGAGSDGTLGNGTNTSTQTTPVQVSGLSDIVQIAAGGSTTCARTSDGTLRCWGLNSMGQVGDQTYVNRNTPTSVLGITGARDVATFNEHSCSLLSDDSLRCWGTNSWWQLGDGTRPFRNFAHEVVGLSATAFAGSRSSTGGFTCALLSDQTVQCWGNGTSGQLGNGINFTQPAPTPVSGLSSVTAISAGAGSNGSFACALLSTGSVRCWGSNGQGQLGDGTGTSRSSPVTVNGISNAIGLVSGTQHSCALLADRTMRCWGYNSSGELGIGNTSTQTATVQVANLENVTSMALGEGHSCALQSNGTVWCWGRNTSGQLGDGTVTSRSSPVQVQNLPRAISISAGGSTSCALLVDLSVRCWGDNWYSSTGDGTTTTRLLPVSVLGVSGVTRISSGKGHTCASLSDGSTRCWGSESDGQRGTGIATFSTSNATPLYEIPAASRVEAMGYHTCALSAGNTYCWGENVFSGIGLNETTARAVSGF